MRKISKARVQELAHYAAGLYAGYQMAAECSRAMVGGVPHRLGSAALPLLAYEQTMRCYVWCNSLLIGELVQTRE